MLAVHFTEAESVLGTERLIYYSIVAGEAAFASHAHETALDHFERAVEARHDAQLDAVGARALAGRGIARAADNLEREAAGDVLQAFEFWVAEGVPHRHWNWPFVRTGRSSSSQPPRVCS